jgi:2-succinyl-5-enolpyruvyl-6-hydroxy-3-cyclohexene-1-carboxylate synthase
VLTLAAERLETEAPRSSGWQSRWLRASEIAGSLIDSVMSAPPTNELLSELSAVQLLLRALPHGSRFVLGNSLPIRHVDLLATRAGLADPDTTIFIEALRGASGIDGVTSSAVGFSLSDDRPTTLLVGDISYLHDVGGLWAAQQTSAPLAIVVLNNGGGRIFEQLPISRVAKSAEMAHWTTPHELDLSHAAALYGLAHLRVTTRHGVAEALREAHSHPGTTVIEIPVVPGSAKSQAAQLVQAVSSELVRTGFLNRSAATGTTAT